MKKINFLGDSITEGFSVRNPDNIYTNIISRELPAIVNNYGIGGTRIAKQKEPSLNPKYDLFFGSRVKDMERDVDLVFVFGGTNDFGHGDALIGEDADRTPDTFYGGMHYLINELLTYYRKEQIVFILPLHRLWENNVYGSGDKEIPSLPLSGYVEIIKKVCDEYNIKTLDYREEMGPAINSPYLSDGLHLNDKGHIKLASLLLNYLRNGE